MAKISIFGGAGYAGGELIRLVLEHPLFELGPVCSRSHAGQLISDAHPHLRGVLDHIFCESVEEATEQTDAVFLAVGHGDGMVLVNELLLIGFSGPIVDLSADFRLPTAKEYADWYGCEHIRPDLLDSAWYGLPEITGAPPPGTTIVANPGCFATAIALALYPVTNQLPDTSASVTALTGASGAGVTPTATTHFPNRDGNVRAYNVMRHRHQAEVQHIVGTGATVAFVPVSGPWTRGIWGTATISLPAGINAQEVTNWFEEAYGDYRFIRLQPGILPELRNVVHSPFCDIGWVLDGQSLIVGFTLDNLMKGASSQAIQNMNLVFGLEDFTGLLPTKRVEVAL